MKNVILQGDALSRLKDIPEKSVNMCMTSPPYWALRDYGVDGQLGLEPTFDDYINQLCDIFDGVKNVLKDDGTCWVNLGDTYYGGGFGKSTDLSKTKQGTNRGTAGLEAREKLRNIRKNLSKDIPTKSLTMIPMRFAIEMVNRGWILRNTIIWHKPNPMPQSVKDRFTVDFEYIFLFSKKKKYYFKQQLEPFKSKPTKLRDKRNENYGKAFISPLGKGLRSGYEMGARNKRTTWSICPRPYKEAHFATYPEELCETPIDAGCPVDGVVLDPFFGAGTTGLVALKQNKNYIGIELNPEYIEIAEKRLKPIREQSSLNLKKESQE